MATVPERTTATQRALTLVLLLGVAVAVLLGVYARVHHTSGHPLFTLGFSGVLQMKTWLTSAATLVLIVQLGSALWMWGRLPHVKAPAPNWVVPLHRYSGAVAFTLTVPVALNCIWALGFATYSFRVIVHSVAGCLFYGAYAAKMLGLRIKGLPGWALPVLGGAVLTLLVVLWLHRGTLVLHPDRYPADLRRITAHGRIHAFAALARCRRRSRGRGGNRWVLRGPREFGHAPTAPSSHPMAMGRHPHQPARC